MRKNREIQIDGTTWTVNQFSSTEGVRLFSKLLNLCGSTVAQVFRALPNGRSLLDAELNTAMLATAVEDFCGRLDEDVVDEVFKRLLACTFADGKEVIPQYDIIFQGRYATLIQVVAFVVEVNYSIPLHSWLKAVSADGAPAATPTAD